MGKSWLLLVFFVIAGSAGATTIAPRRCAPGTWPTKWVQPAFPTTFKQRSVRSVIAYVALDTAGSVQFAEAVEVELFPYGQSAPSKDFHKALAAAVVSWRFPQQPSRCVMHLKLPIQSPGWWPNNSFKPKPLRSSA